MGFDRARDSETTSCASPFWLLLLASHLGCHHHGAFNTGWGQVVPSIFGPSLEQCPALPLVYFAWSLSFLLPQILPSILHWLINGCGQNVSVIISVSLLWLREFRCIWSLCLSPWVIQAVSMTAGTVELGLAPSPKLLHTHPGVSKGFCFSLRPISCKVVWHYLIKFSVIPLALKEFPKGSIFLPAVSGVMETISAISCNMVVVLT